MSLSAYYSSLVAPRLQDSGKLVPGFVLVIVITSAAYGLRQLPGMANFSPMITAIFIGILFANLTTVPAVALPGLSMCGKKVLRMAVALLGLQLTFSQVAEVGVVGMIALVGLVTSTFGFTHAVGRLLRVEPGLTGLLAAGTAICGASAIAAANAVVKCRDEDVAYAVASVTLFGTLAMLAFPAAAPLFDLSHQQFGFWVGSSVHEVAQVVAAGFHEGTAAGEFSVIVKLSRILLLAPLLIVVAALVNRRRMDSTGALSQVPVIPGFVVGFIVAVIVNSFALVPGFIREPMVTVTPVLLTAALAALGLSTRYDALKAKGMKPLLLAAFASLYIAIGGLALTGIFG